MQLGETGQKIENEDHVAGATRWQEVVGGVLATATNPDPTTKDQADRRGFANEPAAQRPEPQNQSAGILANGNAENAGSSKRASTRETKQVPVQRQSQALEKR
jgi:hypothetical protein